MNRAGSCGGICWTSGGPKDRSAVGDRYPVGEVKGGDTYEVRVVGAVGAAARQAFADSAVDVEPTATVLSAGLDRAGPHAVLDQVHLGSRWWT